MEPLNHFNPMQCKKIFLLFALVVLSTSCSPLLNEKNENIKSSILSLDELSKFLQNDINSLPNFNCYSSQDSVIEGDEGLKWNSKVYKYKNEIAFLIEANWEKPNIVDRITVFSNTVRDGNLFVGQTFSLIKSSVSNILPYSPDGYLFVTYKKNPKISIELNISNIKDSTFFFGVKSIDNIPDSIKVESLILMK